MTQEQRELFKQLLDSIEYYTITKKIGTSNTIHNITFYDQETDEEICSIQTMTYTDKKQPHKGVYLPCGKRDKERFKKAKELAKESFTTIDDLHQVI